MLGSVAASFPPAAWLVHECEHTSIPGAGKKGCAESDPSHNVLSVQGVAFTIGGVACGVQGMPRVCSLGEATRVAASLSHCPGLGDRTVCRPEKSLAGSMVPISFMPQHLPCFSEESCGVAFGCTPSDGEIVLFSFPSHWDPCFLLDARGEAACGRNVGD